MAVVTSFSLDQIVVAVSSYFADPSRNIVADVLEGEWNTEVHYGAPRVVVGLARFGYRDACGTRWAPNSWWDNGDGTVSPVIGARYQMFKVWVHSVAPNGTTPDQNAVAARKATAALSDVTFAAIREAHGASFPDGDGDWLNEARGDFVYGSVAWWSFVVPIPILGDPMPVVRAATVGFSAQLLLNDAVAATDASTVTFP